MRTMCVRWREVRMDFSVGKIVCVLVAFHGREARRKERDRDGNKLSFAVPIKTVSQALPKWWVGTTKVPFPPIGGYGG